MGAIDTSYKAPGISFTNVASQAVGSGPGVQGVLALLGTAPKGTNQPKLFQSLGDAQLEYGTAQDSASPGQSGGTFNLEPGLELAFAQAGNTQGLQVRGIRVGATLGVVNIPNGSGGTAFGLTAQPPYAGSNVMQAVASVSTYDATVGSYKQSLSLYDNTVGQQTLLEQYVGWSPQDLNDQINTKSQLMTSVTSGGAGTTQNNFGTAATYTLTGALDGSNAQPADYVAALALAEAIDCDFIVALSGDTTVQAGLLSHVTKMFNEQNPREGIVGLKYQAQPKALVINQALQQQASIVSSQLMFLANTGGYRRDPVTGINRVYDGYYMAAALGAMKAANNPAEPLTRKNVAGILSLTETFTNTDLDQLAQQGVIALTNTPPPVRVYTGVDIGDPGNYRQENIVAQSNRLIKIIMSFVNPLIGRADPVSNTAAIKNATIAALNSAAQNQIIVGFDQANISVVPQVVPGRYTVNVVYKPRIEVSRIDFFLTLNVSL